MNEKEYVKIEVGTFCRFVRFLRLFVDVSVSNLNEFESLQSLIDDFEDEVIHGVDEL